MSALPDFNPPAPMWSHLTTKPQPTAFQRLQRDLDPDATHPSPVAGMIHRSSVMGDHRVFVKFSDKHGKKHEIYLGVDGDFVELRGDDGFPESHFVPTAVRASPSADLLAALAEFADESPKAARFYDQMVRLAADEARS